MTSASGILENEFARLGALDEMHAILRVYGLTLDEVLAKKRTPYCRDGGLHAGTKSVADTRGELMCLLRERGLSYPKIARAFQRDNNTVIQTIKRINSRRSIVPQSLRTESLDQRVLRLERQVTELKGLVAVLTMRPG